MAAKKPAKGRTPPGTGLQRQRKGPFGNTPRTQGGLGAMNPEPQMPPGRGLGMGDPMGTMPRPVVTGMGQDKGKSKKKK